MSSKKSGSAAYATPKNENGANPALKSQKFSGSTSGKTYRSIEEEVVVPKLKFNGAERISSNYHEFADALHQAAALKFGAISRIIKINDWPLLAPPSAPAVDNVTSQLELDLLMEDYKEERKIVIRENAKIRSMASQMFAKILVHLSEESLAAVKEADDWDDIELEEDPVRLWNRVRDTHLTTTSSNIELDKLRARKLYNSLKQFKNESLASFKSRTTNALKVLTAVQEVEPSPQAQAMDFVSRLDTSKFADLQKTLENNVILGTGTYPRTLNEAYTIAQNIKVVSQGNLKAAELPNTAFVVSASSATTMKSKHKSHKKTDNSSKVNVETAAATGSEKKNKKKEPGPCRLCGDGSRHWARGPDCKFKNTSQLKNNGSNNVHRGDNSEGHMINFAFSEPSEALLTTVKAGIDYLDKYDILLDNQCTASLFHNSDLLTNIRQLPNPIPFTGLGSINIQDIGTNAWFGDVYYSNKSPANVLSFAEVSDRFDVEWNCDDQTFIVRTPTDTFKFVRKGKLYACNVREHLCYAHVITTTENEAKYTKREVEMARQAKELSQLLSYPSSKDLITLINNGSILNCPISAHDVARAVDIYGPDIGSLKGKTKRSKSQPVKVEYISKSVWASQEMHIDLMFVEGDIFLISVTKPLGLTMISSIQSKSTAAIKSALAKQIGAYTYSKFTITTILTDGEGAVQALSDYLLSIGIKVNPTGAGQHVPVIENKIRQVKERVRAILNTLPFNLPSTMMKHLVSYAVSSLNMMPCGTRVDNISPREAFTGRKIDYKRDLKVAFGDYIQANVPNVSDQDVKSLKSQTVGAIAIGSVGNLQGSIKAIDLSSMQVITRDKFTILPMPPSVIDYLNGIAEKQKRKISKDPIFRFGNEYHRYITENDVTETIDNDIEDIIDQYVDRTTVSIHDRGDINIPSIDMDVSDPPVIVSKADDLVSPIKYIDNPMHMAKVEVGNLIQNESSTIEELPDVTKANLLSDFDLDEIHNDNPIVTSPERIQVEDVYTNRLPVEITYEHMPRYNLRQRHGDWRQGPWQERERVHEYGLHITAGAAVTKFGDKALEVMKKELQQMLDKKVWKPVMIRDLSEEDRKKIIPSSIFLKEKFKPSGEFEKLKARLVAGGHRQNKLLYQELISSSDEINIYNNKLTSPTVNIQCVMMEIAKAAYENRFVCTVDITGAYLNAKMGSVRVHMRLDKRLTELLISLDPSYNDYVNSDGTLVVILDKALYGCVEAARLWYECLVGALERIGFVKNAFDKCVVNLIKDGYHCTMCIYVDDLLITCVNKDVIDYVVNYLHYTFKTITVNHGDNHSYLGMDITIVDNKAELSMKGYIDQLLQQYGINTGVNTPASNDLFVIHEDSALLDNDMRQQFHSAVAKLLYLGKRMRVDILMVVIFLTTRVQRPTLQDMHKLKRLFKYIYQTRDLTMTLGIKGPNIQVRAYADASYAIHEDKKSHSGSLITLGIGIVFADSTKQKLVAKSSTEAEFITLSDSASPVIWSRNYFIEQDYPQLPAIIYQDNTSSIYLALKGQSDSKKTKHIAVRYFFIKNYVERNELKIVYVQTSKMLADMLTKPLQGNLFNTLRAIIFGKVEENF